MTELSPAAQAVLDAYRNPYICRNLYAFAAALRALADQVMPEEPHPGLSQFWDNDADQEWQQRRHFRAEILAIAAELEGADD